jgi:hypothetical protein
MDRNLGASQVATSSDDAAAFGDLYQWGRGPDGHQLRTSATTTTLSSTDNPGHGDFILVNIDIADWRSPQNANLWQGVNGINNPCPAGYRIPTNAELDEERASWSMNGAAGAFASPLKFTLAGLRGGGSGRGYYWSSGLDGFSSRYLYFQDIGAGMNTVTRGFGMTVRCIKD